jgi:hypothetical protein
MPHFLSKEEGLETKMLLPDEALQNMAKGTKTQGGMHGDFREKPTGNKTSSGFQLILPQQTKATAVAPFGCVEEAGSRFCSPALLPKQQTPKRIKLAQFLACLLTIAGGFCTFLHG